MLKHAEMQICAPIALCAAAMALCFAGAASRPRRRRRSASALPTKTYCPTIICETALRQKLFEKEGIKAELTIYRSGAETLRGDGGGRRRPAAQFLRQRRGRPQEGRE